MLFSFSDRNSVSCDDGIDRCCRWIRRVHQSNTESTLLAPHYPVPLYWFYRWQSQWIWRRPLCNRDSPFHLLNNSVWGLNFDCILEWSQVVVFRSSGKIVLKWNSPCENLLWDRWMNGIVSEQQKYLDRKLHTDQSISRRCVYDWQRRPDCSQESKRNIRKLLPLYRIRAGGVRHCATALKRI